MCKRIELGSEHCIDSSPPKHRSTLEIAADLARMVDCEHRSIACEAAKRLVELSDRIEVLSRERFCDDCMGHIVNCEKCEHAIESQTYDSLDDFLKDELGEDAHLFTGDGKNRST